MLKYYIESCCLEQFWFCPVQGFGDLSTRIWIIYRRVIPSIFPMRYRARCDIKSNELQSFCKVSLSLYSQFKPSFSQPRVHTIIHIVPYSNSINQLTTN